MNNLTFLQQDRELPTPVAQMLEAQNWEALIEALDNGLPANLESQGDVPLFEHILFNIENGRTEEQIDTPAAPLSVIEALLRHGLDPAGCYNGHATHIAIAINYGQWDWAQHLIDLGFPVETEGNSALIAMTMGRFERAVLHATKAATDELPDIAAEPEPEKPQLGGNVHAFPGVGKPTPEEPNETALIQTGKPLAYGSSEGSNNQSRLDAIVQSLIAAGADPQAKQSREKILLANQPENTALPPLMHSITQMDRGMVRALIRAGVDLTERPDDIPGRPLEMAVSLGATVLVEDLLEAGAPVSGDPKHDDKNQKMFHPLALCVQFDRPYLIESIGKRMTAEDLDTFGTVAMHLAAAGNNIPCMRAIRLLGVSYNVATTQNGFLPIHQAAFAGSEEALAFLIRRGQKWDAQNAAGLTAQDVLASHHPHLMEKFGLVKSNNVHTLLGRKRKP